MKMTKDKFHPELKSIPFAASVYTYLLSRKSGFRLLSSPEIALRKNCKND